jgi:hypothetical protein
MSQIKSPIFVAETKIQAQKKEVQGEYVSLLGEQFYKIKNYTAMPPFFMSLVSSSNHWMFIPHPAGYRLAASTRRTRSSLITLWTNSRKTARIPAHAH